MKKLSVLFLIFVWIPYCNISAQTRSLNSVALEILTESPEFLLEKYSLDSRIEELKTYSNLPDPGVGGEYLVAPAGEENRWATELSWDLEWPGVYKARSNQASLEKNLAETSLYGKRLERLGQIKELLIDYIQCRTKLSLLENLSSNNDSIYALAETASRGGELTRLDLNKIKLEYANIRGAKAAIIAEEADILAKLSELYGNDCTPLLTSMVCEFPSIYIPDIAVLNTVMENSPKIRLAADEAQVANQAKKVASREALPSISFGYKHAYEEGSHFNGGILGISIPIFSSRGKQKAAKAGLTEAEFKIEAAKTETETELAQLFKRLSLLKAEIEEISPLIVNADYHSTLLKAYKNGVITLIDYLTDRNYFTNAEIELVSLKHEAALTQIRLSNLLNNGEF